LGIGIEMKSLILTSILLFSLTTQSWADCGKYKMDVVEVQKTESCYSFFNVVFQDKGCEYDCFQDVSRFVVMQGGEVKTEESGVNTTYYAANFRNPDCNVEDVSLIVYDQSGDEMCRQDFTLSAEYDQHQASLAKEKVQAERAKARAEQGIPPRFDEMKEDKEAPRRERPEPPVEMNVPKPQAIKAEKAKKGSGNSIEADGRGNSKPPVITKAMMKADREKEEARFRKLKEKYGGSIVASRSVIGTTKATPHRTTVGSTGGITVTFDLKEDADVVVRVLTEKGRTLREVKRYLLKGRQSINWDLFGDDGAPAQAGKYLIQIRAKEGNEYYAGDFKLKVELTGKGKL